MSSAKRQRTKESDNMAVEHMGSPVLDEGSGGKGGRRGESAVGGTLRLDIASCLQPIEAEMFSLMLEAVKLSKSGTVVRVAGGWVRDKLLGLEVRRGDAVRCNLHLFDAGAQDHERLCCISSSSHHTCEEHCGIPTVVVFH